MALSTSDDGMPDLQPDYSKKTSHLDVYRDFAIKYLEHTSDLDLLSFVEHDEDDDLSSPALPSWIPRWDRGASVLSFLDTTVFKSNNDDKTVHIDDESVLRVKATIHDSVIYASSVFKKQAEISAKVEEVIRLWREVAPQSMKCPGPHQNRLELAFLGALCQGSIERPLDEFPSSRMAFIQLLQSDQPHEPMAVYTQDSDARRVPALMTHNRRLVLFSNGCYGYAPASTREGDVWAVICGTCTPFILRKVPGKSRPL